MNNFYIIGQRKYDMALQVNLIRLISNEQTELLALKEPFTKQEEIILYGTNTAMHKNDNYPEYSHLYYINEAGKKLFDDHGIQIEEILGTIKEKDLPKTLSILVQNIRFT